MVYYCAAANVSSQKCFFQDSAYQIRNNLTHLYEKLDNQEELLHKTRSILLNTSVSNVQKENNELRQSVRIADNELKIIGLREEVGVSNYFVHVLQFTIFCSAAANLHDF